MNLGYAATVALLDGAVLPPQFSADRLNADDVWQLLSTVDVQLDEALQFATDLTITMRDGTAPHKRIDAPHGAPDDPVTNDELVAKYRSLAGPILDADRLTAIENAVLGLDDLADLNELTALLAAPVAGTLD
jgi:2-methylcitrate dehydratase PrpD